MEKLELKIENTNGELVIREGNAQEPLPLKEPKILSSNTGIAYPIGPTPAPVSMNLSKHCLQTSHSLLQLGGKSISADNIRSSSGHRFLRKYGMKIFRRRSP